MSYEDDQERRNTELSLKKITSLTPEVFLTKSLCSFLTWFSISKNPEFLLEHIRKFYYSFKLWWITIFLYYLFYFRFVPWWVPNGLEQFIDKPTGPNKINTDLKKSVLKGTNVAKPSRFQSESYYDTCIINWALCFTITMEKMKLFWAIQLLFSNNVHIWMETLLYKYT